MRVPLALRIPAAAAVLALVLGPVGAAAQQPFSALRPALEARIAHHHGVVGLALIDPKTGETLAIRGDETFPTASVIKLGVLTELFHRIAGGSLHLDDPLVMLAGDREPGSGILQLLHAPHELTVKDAATLMIAVSDNTATNLLVNKLGIRAVNARMDSLGLKHTRLWAKVFERARTTINPDSSAKYGLGSTTPLEIAKLMAMIYDGTVVSPDASKQMVDMLEKQFYGVVEIPRYLPADVTVAHKTGETDATRNDVAIVYAKPRDYVLAVLTKENEDRSWRLDNDAAVLIGDLSRIVYDGVEGTATSER